MLNCPPVKQQQGAVVVVLVVFSGGGAVWLHKPKSAATSLCMSSLTTLEFEILSHPVGFETDADQLTDSS